MNPSYWIASTQCWQSIDRLWHLFLSRATVRSSTETATGPLKVIVSAVSHFSTLELIGEFATPDQDIFGNPIQLGTRVRSFNLATLLNDGRIYGMETGAPPRIVWTLWRAKWSPLARSWTKVALDTRSKLLGNAMAPRGVDTSDVCYGRGHLAYPPLNDTPKSSGRVTFGVVAISPP